MEEAGTMSALGQKQTFRCFAVMSALPPKADIGRHHFDVRFVPEADITLRGTPTLIATSRFLPAAAEVTPRTSAAPINVRRFIHTLLMG
jgi:hypothetical protein